HHPQGPALNKHGLALSESRTSLGQRPFGQPLADVVDHEVIDGAGLAVLLEHPANAGRPTDEVPALEAVANLQEDIARKDPPLPPVADTARLGPGRRGEPGCVPLDAVQPQVFADLRLSVRRNV